MLGKGFVQNYEVKLRAAIKDALPENLQPKKKVQVAEMLRKIASEYDGLMCKALVPLKKKGATKKKKVRAGDAVAGFSIDSVDLEEAGDLDPAMRAATNPYGKDGAALGCFMADPQEPKRMMWDFMVIMPCLAYLTMMMPFRMTFNNGERVGHALCCCPPRWPGRRRQGPYLAARRCPARFASACSGPSRPPHYGA